VEHRMNAGEGWGKFKTIVEVADSFDDLVRAELEVAKFPSRNFDLDVLSVEPDVVSNLELVSRSLAGFVRVLLLRFLKA